MEEEAPKVLKQIEQKEEPSYGRFKKHNFDKKGEDNRNEPKQEENNEPKKTSYFGRYSRKRFEVHEDKIKKEEKDKDKGKLNLQIEDNERGIEEDKKEDRKGDDSSLVSKSSYNNESSDSNSEKE